MTDTKEKIISNVKGVLALLIYLALFSGCGTFSGSSETHEAEARIQDFLGNIREKVQDSSSNFNEVVGDISFFKNYLVQSKIIGDFSFETSYRPHLLLALSNEDSLTLNKSISKSELYKRTEGYSKLHYVNFTIENTNYKSELLRYELPSVQDYSNRIMYYSFYCNKDAYLIENGRDTIRNGFIHFERTFDVSPKLNITFVFERISTSNIDKLTFVFDDIIFNNGKLHFEFDYSKFSVLNATELKKILS